MFKPTNSTILKLVFFVLFCTFTSDQTKVTSPSVNNRGYIEEGKSVTLKCEKPHGRWLVSRDRWTGSPYTLLSQCEQCPWVLTTYNFCNVVDEKLKERTMVFCNGKDSFLHFSPTREEDNRLFIKCEENLSSRSFRFYVRKKDGQPQPKNNFLISVIGKSFTLICNKKKPNERVFWYNCRRELLAGFNTDCTPIEHPDVKKKSGYSFSCDEKHSKFRIEKMDYSYQGTQFHCLEELYINDHNYQTFNLKVYKEFIDYMDIFPWGVVPSQNENRKYSCFVEGIYQQVTIQWIAVYQNESFRENLQRSTEKCNIIEGKLCQTTSTLKLERECRKLICRAIAGDYNVSFGIRISFIKDSKPFSELTVPNIRASPESTVPDIRPSSKSTVPSSTKPSDSSNNKSVRWWLIATSAIISLFGGIIAGFVIVKCRRHSRSSKTDIPPNELRLTQEPDYYEQPNCPPVRSPTDEGEYETFSFQPVADQTDNQPPEYIELFDRQPVRDQTDNQPPEYLELFDRQPVREFLNSEDLG